MPTETGPTSTPPGRESAPAAQPRVIVYGEKEKKKRKKKYSRLLEAPQKAAWPASRAVTRVADAVAAGLHKWRTESDKSARKKRDGMIRDLPENSARAAVKTVRVASLLPLDVAKTIRRAFFSRSVLRAIRF